MKINLIFLFLGIIVGGLGGFGYVRFKLRRYGKLLSFLAHEINTPVTSLNLTVLNFVQGVFGPVSKEHEEWMQILREQSMRVSYLIGDLRDLIHMELHRDMSPQPEGVKLGPLTEELLATMKSSMARAGAKIDAKLDRDLPEVYVDKERMQRVIVNLLLNARKFQNGGVISIGLHRARLERAKNGQSLDAEELTVSFQGIALAQNEAKRMMNLYYPVKRTGATLPCVGLGFGICRELVVRQGGEFNFSVDSTGLCRIAIRFPVRYAAPAQNISNH